ncbi:repressor LexA [Lactobacillus sp.]|uniref:LexA family protein n=1 Tax=Lactobacillus sp. TaxID=1591 RepID=UPI0019922D5E|nr:repressor LexA [Lactobacillus sp.]MBD5429009.1 repressor LexA [Lactobacillus sp.]
MTETKKHKSKQIQILQYIYDTVEKKKFPPTVREICEAVNLSSTSTVHGHLARLENKGLLYRDATKPRAMEITKAGLKELGIKPQVIPIINSTVNDLDEAMQHATNFFPIPPQLKKFAGKLFMVKIQEQPSNGLLTNDQIIVKRQELATNNELVAVQNVNDQISITRFKNSANYRVLGKVVSLYRNIQ